MTATLAGVVSPDEVILGDLPGLRETADRLDHQARVYQRAADEVDQASSSIAWHGAAGEAFHAAAAPLPERLETAARAHRRAAGAVSEYADMVQRCRSRVDEALGLWEQGDRLSRLALQDAPRERTDSRSRPLTEEPRAPVVDPGAALRAEAVEITAAAQRSVRSAAGDAELELRHAADEAPDDPSIWDRLGGLWSDVWHGASDVAAEAGNGLISWGNAALHHPDMLLEIAAGLALVSLGAEAVGGGGALIATGVGAPEGVVLAAAGVAAVAAGAGLLVEGFGRLSAEAAGDSAVSPLHGAARGGGSGSTSLDAASVRSRVESVTTPGRGRNVRMVEDETKLRELYDELSVGGKDVTPSTGAYARDGKMVELDDGTRVGLRERSSSGGPTIDIEFLGGKKLKIHVEQ